MMPGAGSILSLGLLFEQTKIFLVNDPWRQAILILGHLFEQTW
jgi:hypothetical protein